MSVRHTWNMVRRGARFTLRPSQRRIWFAVERALDVQPDSLVRSGIRGVLVDVDATLVPHHERVFPAEVLRWLDSLVSSGLRVAIYSNARDQAALAQLPVPVIWTRRRKPDPEGFRDAVRRLSLTQSNHVVMIGDNLLTDGAAIEAGLQFIYCRPLLGAEARGHRWVRHAAQTLALGRGGGDAVHRRT